MNIIQKLGLATLALSATALVNAETLTIESASDWGNGLASYPASNAIDGSLAWSSRWAASGSPVNLQLNLGSVQTVTKVGVSWGHGADRVHTFEIWARAATSGDWTKVYDDYSFGTSASIEVYDIDDIDAQQVRIKTFSNTAGSDWTNIKEVEVYGSSSDDSTDPADDDTTDPSDDDTTTGECEDDGQMSYNGSCVEWSDVFEVENGELGESDHIISLSPIEMKFSALEAQHETDNGNGWRHELKIKSSGDYRVGMTEVYELFKAKITINLSDGAKTIVAQHHAATTDTITKLYIADLDESGFENAPDGTSSDSVSMNGIFDVYIRLAKADGSGETKHLLTTIKSGESFSFEEENDHGVVTVSINGESLDSISVDDSSESYFKFGNYHQAQNPETGDKITDHDDWADFYAEYFSDSDITFTNMSYIRNVD